MSGFSFPPPPPPPPSGSASSPVTDIPHRPYHHRGNFNHRANHGRGRGRGRGHSSQNRPQQYEGYIPRETSNVHTNEQWSPTQHSPRTFYNQSQSVGGVGLKRTHNQAFDPQLQQTSASKPESKPKIPPAPSVPRFGFAIPTHPVSINSRPNEHPQPGMKINSRKNNLLGLTPKGDTYQEDEQDVDEEAAYAQSGQVATIQHRGQSIQLNTAADVAAWIAERKKRFPTAARIATRKAAQDEARSQQKAREADKQQRLETRKKAIQAKLEKKKPKDEPGVASATAFQPSAQNEATVPNSDDPLARIPALEEQLRQATEALANNASPQEARGIKSESTNRDEEQISTAKDTSNAIKLENIQPVEMDQPTKAQQTHMQPLDLGLNYDSDVNEDIDGNSEVSSEDPSSDSSEEESDSDAPPEEVSARGINSLGSQMPIQEGPNKSQICYAFANTGKCKYGDKCMRSHDVPCRFFKKNGHCRYGEKCRMSHDVTPGTGKKKSSEKAVPSRPMSLRERMIEKELMEEAAAGLVVIKQLGANGFFNGI